MAIDWTKLDKQDDNLKKRLKQFDRGAKTSGKAEATRSTPTADAAKTLLSSGVNPVAPQGKTIGLPDPVTGPIAPAAQSARTVTTLPVIQTLPTVADRRSAREDAAAQKNIAVPAAGLGGGSASARAGASRSSSAQAQSGFLDGLTVLPSSPQQFAKDFAYGAERAGAGLLNAAENVTDLIGSGFYKGLQGITSLGGAASNPVSEWAGRNADAFLDNSVSRDWEESIRERYQPTKGAENLTGIGQSVVQMLPGIGASKAVSALAGASNALNAAKALRTGEAAGRALFGLQAAGGGANEARAEGAGTGKALAYGAASGLLETTIEGIAGGIPGLGKGKIGEIAQAVKASPAVSKALDIAGEGGEEALSAILTPYLKRAIYDPDAENATAQEIAQSAILGAVAAGVLQAGIELPGAVSNAVSDIRSTRAAIGSNADIARRAGQRLSTPQTLPVRDNPLVTLLPDASKAMQNLHGSPFESAQAAQTQTVNTDPIQTMNAAPAGAVEAAGQNKTASMGETGAYRAAKPENVEMPTVPIINLSMQTVADMNGGVLPKTGNALRKDAISRARVRLGLDQNGAAYIPASNVVRNGEEYVLKITRSSLDKMLSPSNGGIVSPESIAVIDNIERIANNGVYFKSEGDRKGRQQIAGYDHLMTTVYIDDQPYSVDMRVRVYDAPSGGENRLYYFTPEEIVTTKKVGANIPTGTLHERTMIQDETPTVAPIIADSYAKGNTQYAQNSGGQTGDDGVGAANAGFAGDYNRLQNQSERFHPEGEKAARPVDVPVEDFQGRSIPKSAATVLEAGATPDSAVEVIEQAIANGEFSFDRITDEAAQKRARQTVESKGWDAARESFHQQAAGGKAGKHTMALGQLLLNNAMNAGDSRAVIDILTDYATLSTQSAQAMQAQRMLKKLSPEGQLYGIQRSVENLRGELAERYGDKAPDLNIDEALVDQFLQAQDQAGRDAALDAIRKNIADQIPSTPMDKFNALRYLRMLGNLKTQAKNLTGNATMLGLRTVKDRVAAGIEFVVSGASKGKYQKMKAFVYDPALFKAAWNDYKEVRSAALGEQKYSSRNGRFPKEIDEKRTIFKNNGDWGTLPTSSRAAKAARKATDVLWTGLEGYRKATNAAMEYGDLLFSRINYADAMGQYLAAHGVIADQMERGAVDAGLLDDARAYAIREAQQATFRDNNAVSGAIAKMGGVFRNPKNAAEAIGNASAQGTAPFLKTPANVVVRMEEYSPLGLINTLVNGGRLALGSKSVTGADIVDSLAKSLTGTGLFALGAALYNAGRLVGGPDDDDEQEELNLLTGGQNYAYVDAEGNSSTLEWLSPAAGPMFMGVEFAKLAGERGYDIWAVLEAAKSITNPMLEMSMMQGINSQLESISYSDDPLTDLMLNSLVSYLTQGLTSTLGGQIERTSEDLRMTTFRDKTAAMPTDVQQRLGKLSAKLPGFDFQQIPYIDGWGRTESNGTLLPRAVENFLAPWYSSQKNATEADKEIQRLLSAGQSGVVPKRTPQSVEVTYKENPKDEENQKRYLNAEEYVSYATVKGQTSYDLAMDMINSDEYRSMTDEQKAEALKLAYAYAGHVAAEEVTDGKHESEAYVALAQAAKKELGLSEAEYLLLYEEYGGALVNGDKVREAYQQGMEPETWLEYASGKSAYNSDGEGGLTIAETAKSIRESGLTKDQQELLWLVSYPEWPEKADKAGVPISDYIAYKAATAGLKKSAEKKAALIDAGLPTSLYDKIG